MADTVFATQNETQHSRHAESFEVTYWADRFGVSPDQVRELVSESEAGSLDDSLFDRLH